MLSFQFEPSELRVSRVRHYLFCVLQNGFHSLNFLFLFEILQMLLRVWFMSSACFVRCKNVFPSLNWQRLQLSRPNKGLFVPYRLCFVHHHFGKWVVRALEWNWWWSTNRSCYYCWIDHDKKNKKNNWPCWLCQNAVANRDKPVDSLGKKID